MSTYLELFDAALANYTTHQRRPGYANGWFTFLRHSYTMYPALVVLRKNIAAAPNDDIAQQTISAFLLDLKKQGKIHNHSFASYFLDKLSSKNNNESVQYWNSYTPPRNSSHFILALYIEG